MSSSALAYAGMKITKAVISNPDKVLYATAVAAPVVIPAAIAVGVITWLSKP